MNNFLEILQTSGNNVSLLVLLISFLGGVIASVSPCSLAMLPIIVGYIGGYSDNKPLRTFIQMIFFVIGMSVVFSLVGVICAITGRVFISFAPTYFLLIIASLLLVMGLNIIGVLEINLPVLVKQMPTSNKKGIFLYPMLLGIIFAFAGTPCSTPILAGIMSVAAISDNIVYAVMMLFLFSLGQGVILVAAAVFTSMVKGLRNFAHVTNLLLKISGIFLILAALFIYYKVFSPYF
ncbi:cytochrome c biogenesis protein CcdA [bacterium]|nr:cytochrome c biogenesis protein CcdA [bacterium]